MRRASLALLVALALFTTALTIGRTDDTVNGFTPVTLKEQLQKGLRCQRPVDFEFCEHVVHLVDTGVLKREMVLGTFDWARKKRRPEMWVIYFEWALQKQAAKIGVTLAVPDKDPFRDNGTGS
jgi:hypothetical protein